MFKGRKAIVTGGSRGIGYAIASALSERGARVLITGRNEESLEKAAKRIGCDVIPFVWDVSRIDSMDEKFNEATEMLGGFDILVNNAGIFTPKSEWTKKELLTLTPVEWESVMRTNSESVFFMMQKATQYMIRQGVKGNILNISSVAGYEPVFGAYGASKTCAVALTRGWGKMFASDGITINGIAPGPVATEMNNWHEGDPMEHSRIPYGRFAAVDEIAGLAVYLLSPGAKMVCGETVVLDGGYSIR